MTAPQLTVRRSDLSTIKMVAGLEDVYTRVIDDGVLKEWVGIGWVNVGPATDADRAKYPTVVEQ